MRKLTFFALLLLLLLGLAVHADEKSSEVKFSVVKEETGKPVRNASVILHEVDKDGHQSKGGLQLKTDPDGHATFPGARYGKMRVQVLAKGFQTFGEDYEINQPTQEIVIKLKTPQKQYSIYEDNPKK